MKLYHAYVQQTFRGKLVRSYTALTSSVKLVGSLGNILGIMVLLDQPDTYGVLLELLGQKKVS